MSNNKIKIQAIVAGDINKVWDYYILPQHITKWNFASDDWHCPNASNDMRIGGKYVARMEAKDGSFGFDFEAVYTEIIDKGTFSYTMEDGRQVDVTFKEKGDSTEVTIHFDAESTNSVEMQRNGWQAILNNFKKHVESQ